MPSYKVETYCLSTGGEVIPEKHGPFPSYLTALRWKWAWLRMYKGSARVKRMKKGDLVANI